MALLPLRRGRRGSPVPNVAMGDAFAQRGHDAGSVGGDRDPGGSTGPRDAAVVAAFGLDRQIAVQPGPKRSPLPLFPPRHQAATGLALIRAQETERRRIARDLHDTVGQALAAVKIGLDRVLRDGDREAVRHEIVDAIAIVDLSIAQVRSLALDLRPPILDDFGLIPALRWYARRHAGHAGLGVGFESDDIDGLLDPGLESACFRIGQEAITNAIRHARATRLDVEVRIREAQLCLEIRDDGRGLDLAAIRAREDGDGGVGLPGMRERAALLGGGLEIETSPGRGTVVRARFPLDRTLTTARLGA